MKNLEDRYLTQDDIDKDDILYQQNKEEDKTDGFKRAYKKMCSVFLEESEGMNLYNILKEIILNNNKDFIFNFTRKGEIKKVIHSIKTRYRFNQDEAEDCTIFVITEIFCDNNLFNELNLINLDDFNENFFIEQFKNEVAKRVHKMMREGYCAKEIPATDQPVYIYQVSDDFEDKLLNDIDLKKALEKINNNDKVFLKLKFINELNQNEIGREFGLTQPSISYKINKIISRLNKYMSN
jgi:RNA polymerase sigma factor (sigma-70 family)